MISMSLNFIKCAKDRTLNLIKIKFAITNSKHSIGPYSRMHQLQKHKFNEEFYRDESKFDCLSRYCRMNKPRAVAR